MRFYYEIFKKIRKGKKLSAAALAKAIDKSYHAINKWEKGERNPSAGDIRLMAAIMGIRPSEISDLSDEISTVEALITEKKGSRLSNSLLAEKYIAELHHIVNNYGNVPEVNLEAIIQLENKVAQTEKQNEMLKKSLQHYKDTLNLTPAIIYAKDSTLHYRYVNELFIQNTGFLLKDDILGATSSELFGIDESKEIIDYEKKALKNNGTTTNKEVFIPGTNKENIGLLNIHPLKRDDGSVEIIICSIKDITYLKKLLDRLGKLDFLLDSMDDYIYIKTIKPERFIYRSQGIENITGHKRIDFYNDKKLWDEIIHKDDIFAANKLPQNLENQQIKEKFRILQKNGQYKWVENTCYKKYMPDLKIYYIYGIIRDISEQVRREDLEELLKIHTDFMEYGVGIMDYETKEYMYINKAYEKMTGYTHKEIGKSDVCDFVLNKLTLPEDREKLSKYLEDESISEYNIKMVNKKKEVKLFNIKRNNIMFKGRKCRFVAMRLENNNQE
jgi:PAS domain S-box-containing protein